MKIRFKFSKTGRLKYIGHLDLLNIWNRAIKSAKLPVCYSKGFNPHMLVSFASPLSLGLTSTAEYVDIDFEETEPLSLPPLINKRFPDCLEITEVFLPKQPYERVAANVTAAEYAITAPVDISQAQINEFMSLEKVEVIKKTKRKNELADIMPDIISVKKVNSEIVAVISCGSNKNLKPTLLMEAIYGFLNYSIQPYETKINRTEIFAQKNDGELIPLSYAGCV